MNKTMILTGLMSFSLLLGSITIQAKDIKDKNENAEAKTESTTAESGIKPTVSDKPQVTSFNGGFILSRVELKASNDLSPYADKKENNYSEKSKSLAGLVVFHTGGKNNKLAKGMYVWDGDQWQKVSYEL